MTRSLLLLGLVLTLSPPCSAASPAGVRPYPLPAPAFASPFYTVTLTQDEQTIAAPVLISHARKPDTNPHPDTSWAGFAFTGAVTVTVARTDPARPIRTARVLPAQRQLTVTPAADGTISFTIDRPGQFAVELDDQLAAHPLLIFADPPETQVPARGAPGVRWFGPGVHDLGPDVQSVGTGETIYLAPGALVYGRFKGIGATGVHLLGRGILAGTVYPPNPPHTYTAPHLFELAGASDDAVIDGVTFLDSPHYNLLVRGARTTVRHVKMIGWLYGTDGVGVGRDSVVEDCFFKVNDDAIKLYHTGLRVRRGTFWQMENGAPFQFSWNLNEDASDIRVSDCDVVRVEHRTDANNRAVFNAIHGGRGHLHDYVFDDIRIEGPLFRLVRLTARLTEWSRSPTCGDITDITFRHLTVEGPVAKPSLIGSEEATGRFERLTFEHLTIGGDLITDPAAGRFQIDPASTTAIRFLP